MVRQLRDLGHGGGVVKGVGELRAGLEMHPETRAHNERALAALLQDLPVMPFSVEAAASYGVLRAALRERRRDALDRLIAAHAASLSLVLVTNNEADFRDYPGVLVENWVAGS